MISEIDLEKYKEEVIFKKDIPDKVFTMRILDKSIVIQVDDMVTKYNPYVLIMDQVMNITRKLWYLNDLNENIKDYLKDEMYVWYE